MLHPTDKAVIAFAILAVIAGGYAGLVHFSADGANSAFFAAISASLVCLAMAASLRGVAAMRAELGRARGQISLATGVFLFLCSAYLVASQIIR